jgi:hypothetical protein
MVLKWANVFKNSVEQKDNIPISEFLFSWTIIVKTNVILKYAPKIHNEKTNENLS